MSRKIRNLKKEVKCYKKAIEQFFKAEEEIYPRNSRRFTFELMYKEIRKKEFKEGKYSQNGQY
jgi:hypothetical protein